MKQSLLPLICIALIAGCGTNPKEKTSASADHMQPRIVRWRFLSRGRSSPFMQGTARE